MSTSRDPSLAEPATTPDASHADGAPAPGGGEIAPFVVFSFAVLLMFLVSTAWVEVRSKYLYH